MHARLKHPLVTWLQETAAALVPEPCAEPPIPHQPRTSHREARILQPCQDFGFAAGEIQHLFAESDLPGGGRVQLSQFQQAQAKCASVPS